MVRRHPLESLNAEVLYWRRMFQINVTTVLRLLYPKRPWIDCAGFGEYHGGLRILSWHGA